MNPKELHSMSKKPKDKNTEKNKYSIIEITNPEANDTEPPVTSGFGNELKLSIQFYMILLACIVLPIGTGYFFATQFGYQTVGMIGLAGAHGHVRTIFFYVFIAIGVVVAVAIVSVVLLAAGRLLKIEIHVHDYGVEGIGVKHPFFMFSTGMLHFRFVYSKIISVAEKPGLWSRSHIVIKTEGYEISICPPNVQELVAAINSKLQK